MKKDLPKNDSEVSNLNHKRPEYRLWMAVVERAITDYIFFWDWYITRAKFRDGYKLPQTYKRSVNNIMRANLEVLNAFLFDEIAAPTNFAWVFDNCFQDERHLLKGIRDRIKHLHLQNLKKNEDNPILEHIVKQYKLEHGFAELGEHNIAAAMNKRRKDCRNPLRFLELLWN
jgi:hypothetical protein